MTDPEIIDAWIAWLQHNKGRADATAGKYRLSLLRLSAFLEARDKALLTADLAALEEFTGIQAHKDGLTRRSRRPMVAAIRVFYTWAHKQRLLPTNLAADLEYPKTGKRLPVPMALKHAEQLLLQPDISTFAGLRDATMMSVLIGCGIRVSGLCGLNVSSLSWLDLDGKEILILKVKEKGSQERLVPAPAEVRLLVRAYLAHPELNAVDRTLDNGDQVLFISLRNRTIPLHEYVGEHRRITAGAVADFMKAYGKRAGIPESECHPHALRHLFATQLVEQDENMLNVQALMGHKDANTTAIYTQVAMRKLAAVVDRSNPFRGIKTPVSELVRELERRR